jgi:hypothetical protein
MLFSRLMAGRRSKDLIQGILIWTEFKDPDDERHYMLLGVVRGPCVCA